MHVTQILQTFALNSVVCCTLFQYHLLCQHIISPLTSLLQKLEQNHKSHANFPYEAKTMI